MHWTLAWVMLARLWAVTDAPPPRPESAVPSIETRAGGRGALTNNLEMVLASKLEKLSRFSKGEDVGDVASLFDAPLKNPKAVNAQILDLENRLENRDDPSQQALDKQRLSLLTSLRSTLETLSSPARQVLEDLDQPQTGLRQLGEQVASLQPPLLQTAEALSKRITKSRSGGLIGFRTEIERWRDSAELSLTKMSTAAAVAQEVAMALDREALRLETKARGLNDRFLAAALRNDSHAFDRLFTAAIERERAARRRVRGIEVGALKKGLETLAARLPQLTREVSAISNIAAAKSILARVNAAITDIDLALSDASQVHLLFEHAAARESVTLLVAVASPQARREAYRFGAELLGDLRSELLAVRDRFQRYWKALLADVEKGRVVETSRVFWAFLIVVLAVFLHRRAPRMVSNVVKQLAKTRAFRGRVRGLVRWAGLFHAVAPVVVVGLAGYALISIFGLQRPEVRFVEVAFRWALLYALGRSALVGAARRVSAGRPALIDANEETLARLQSSYNYLGLVIAASAAVEEWAGSLLALGRLRSLVETAVVVWVLLWVLAACLSWRPDVAKSLLQHCSPTSRWYPVLTWMSNRRLGALLVVPGVLFLVGAAVWKLLSEVLLKRGVFAYFKAQALRRQASLGANEPDSEPEATDLPEAYVATFPLYPVLGETDSVLVQRTGETDPILHQLDAWKTTQRESSLALVGEKGMGKTTLLAMVRQRVQGIEVNACTLTERWLEDHDVVRGLTPLFGLETPGDLAALIAHLNAGPPRVVILDDAHLTFLRVVNGYRGFDALVSLVSHTGESVFWILAFNDCAWDFLNAAHGGRAYFRRVQRMERWSNNELRNLIGRRTTKAGYTLEFDHQLLDEERGTPGDFRLIEGADGFFRLLWEASRGNPRAATALWLRALRVVDDHVLRVELFSSARTEAFSRAGEDVFFALAAITQHENLTVQELTQTLNIPESFSGYALQFLYEYGIVESKFGTTQRYTVRMHHYAEVLQALQARNLLFTETA